LGEGGTGVLRGRDGWLYWVGRRGEVPALYADTPATRRLIARWTRLFVRRAARAERLGARYVQTIVPEKLAVHPEGLPEPSRASLAGLADPPGARLLRALGAARPGAAADLADALAAARAEGPVYLRTDTHWTWRGYLAAYRALCAALGAAPVAHVFAGARVPDRFTFDLGGKLVPPVAEDYEAYDFPRRARRTHANALVALRESGAARRPGGLFVGSRVVLENPGAPDPRRLVVFGDSYTFDQGPRLTALLAETFSEVHAIWSAEIDWAYVEAVRPDLLLHEIAERFLRRVPRDRLRVDRLAARRVRRALRPTLAARLKGWLRRP
jgi:alginate O-acetyltransferase complex protein AlgJ